MPVQKLRITRILDTLHGSCQKFSDLASHAKVTDGHIKKNLNIFQKQSIITLHANICKI